MRLVLLAHVPQIFARFGEFPLQGCAFVSVVADIGGFVRLAAMRREPRVENNQEVALGSLAGDDRR